MIATQVCTKMVLVRIWFFSTVILKSLCSIKSSKLLMLGFSVDTVMYDFSVLVYEWTIITIIKHQVPVSMK